MFKIPTSLEELKQIAFHQLKESCVPLLTIKSPSDRIILLRALLKTLKSIPQETFSPALGNYVFFPLSTLLQPPKEAEIRNEQVLEITMEVLEVLILKWRISEMQSRILQELWIMTILILGGPLDPSKPTSMNNKGKGKGLGEETELSIIKVLIAIMKPIQTSVIIDTEDDPLGESIDWDGEVPTEKAPTYDYSPSPPIPILFHTLTTLLGIAQISSSLASLQLTALSALENLLQHHLISPSINMEGVSPLLATALPGTASALSRIILSIPNDVDSADQARRQSTNSIVAAMRVLEVLIINCIGDVVTIELRGEERGKEATLEELIEGIQLEKEILETELPIPTPPPLTGPTLPTLAWLNHTILHISTLLHSFSILTSHSSAPVRSSLSSFHNSILSNCDLTLGPSRLISLEQLFSLSGDDWPEVAQSASEGLQELFRAVGNGYDELVIEILRSKLTGLPRILLKGEDVKAINSVRIIITSLSTSTLLEGPGPLKNIERWSGSLLKSLVFDRVIGIGQGKNATSQAWITGSSNGVEESVETDWPLLRMKFIQEEGTKRELNRLWKALGKWSMKITQESEFVEHFLGITLAGEENSSSALLILDGILKGFENEKLTRGRKKVVKSVVNGLLNLLERLELEIEEPKPTSDLIEVPDDLDTVIVELKKSGISLTPTLDSLNPVSTIIPNSQLSQKVLLRSLSLRTLSTCGEILSDSFQPFLLKILYHILSFLSPISHPSLRDHAKRALSLISYSTAYASPQNLIQANVDYIINSVSQRLSITRLDPSAPLVLVEMIRLVGEPIIPMVGDLVEDIFEALDDFHGYDQITLGLWSVLDSLTTVMIDGIELEKQGDEKLIQVEGDEDWKKFIEWFDQRKGELDPEEQEIREDNPGIPFQPKETVEEESTTTKEEIKIPPTKSQTISTQILAKSIYFLSHPSPFLRSRILRLISSSVPLLTTPSIASEPNSSKESNLLPIIHRAWPFILNRINDEESFVRLEACRLIEELGKEVGNFMSRRILEDVWPRFRELLSKQEKEDVKNPVGSSKFTISHQIHFSILKTLNSIIKKVPLKENIVWELSMLLRRFLDIRLQLEIQFVAKEIYRGLMKINGDIVWMTLSGIESSHGLPIFLVMEGMQFGNNVAELLQ